MPPQLRLSGELAPFADEELRAVLMLLAGSTLRWMEERMLKADLM